MASSVPVEIVLELNLVDSVKGKGEKGLEEAEEGRHM